MSPQVWSGLPGERAARLEYPRAAFGAGGLSSWYDLDAYWRNTNAVAFDNWNWLPDVDSLPVGLRVPGLLNLSSPRFVLWSRAQTLEDSSDPAASPATRERAALQDHYAPGWFPITPNHVVTRPWRVVLAEYNELRAVLPSISVWRFPCPLSRAEIVGRNRPVLYPLEQGANSKLSAGFFPSKDPTSTTVGVMVGILDVRQGVLTGLERTEGAPGELPTAGALSLASSRLAEDGWPDVYAFGGVEGGTYSAALFYTTHASVPAVVGLAAATAAAGPPASEGATTVRYTWHRATFSRQPPGRRDAAFVVNGDASRVYVLGGRNGSGALADGWAYDFALRDWVPLPPLRGLAARYDAGAVGFGDLVYLGGGTDSRGRALGDLFVVDGLTGHTQALGNVLPLGARPSLSFDEHYDGLFYAGGTVGGATRRDLWYVRLGAARASRARLVYDFGSGGMGAAESFAVQADLEHGLYWGLPGYGVSPAPIRVVRTNLPSRGSRGEGDEDEHDDRGPERHGNEADAPPCYVVRGAAGSPRVPR